MLFGVYTGCSGIWGCVRSIWHSRFPASIPEPPRVEPAPESQVSHPWGAAQSSRHRASPRSIAACQPHRYMSHPHPFRALFLAPNTHNGIYS